MDADRVCILRAFLTRLLAEDDETSIYEEVGLEDMEYDQVRIINLRLHNYQAEAQREERVLGECWRERVRCYAVDGKDTGHGEIFRGGVLHGHGARDALLKQRKGRMGSAFGRVGSYHFHHASTTVLH